MSCWSFFPLNIADAIQPFKMVPGNFDSVHLSQTIFQLQPFEIVDIKTDFFIEKKTSAA